MNIEWVIKNILAKIKTRNKKQWLFSSFNGEYSDSPKALAEAVVKLYPDIQIIWALNEENIMKCTQNVRSVLINTDEYLRCRNTSGVIIDNVWGESIIRLYNGKKIDNIKNTISLILRRRRGQRIYSIWHGTPLKKIDRDQIGNEDICGFRCNDIKMFVGDEHTAKVMKWNSFDKLPIINLGLPRNDIFFSGKSPEIIKKKLSIPLEKKIILFAPTFRNDGKDVDGKNVYRSGINQLNEFDIDRLCSALAERFGGEWILVCRFHYHVSKYIDWNGINEKYSGRIMNGNQSSDMAEYLFCSDCLITDASSSMFDFALTYRPCFLYFPDVEYYLHKERGVYMNPYNLPFSLSKSFDKLIENIEKFDNENYTIEVRNLLDKLGNKDDGKAAYRIAQYIYNENIKY